MCIKTTLLSIALLAAGTAAAFATPATVTDTVNVHTGPGVEYRVIGQAWAGMDVDVNYCDDEDDWCLINTSGWVRARYLDSTWDLSDSWDDSDEPTYWVDPIPPHSFAPSFAAPKVVPSLHNALPMFSQHNCVSSGVTSMCL